MTMLPRFLALAVAVLVAGCSSDRAERPVVFDLASTARGAVARKPAQVQGPALNRAQIEAYPRPLDLVVLENTRASALVFQIGQNGGVETWASADGKTVAVRQGQIVATRGLGPDLIGALAPSLARVASAGSGPHERELTTLGSEDQTVKDRFICTLEAVGSDTFTIVQRSYTARHVQETCSGDSGAFVNDFWFQGSTLRKSRQWVGSRVGYLRVERLRG